MINNTSFETPDLSVLNVFEPKVRKNILSFCKDLNDSKADIYVVMARKAACLVSVLAKLHLLALNGEVISERVLDCNIDWTQYKSVIIIDDVVISGTTLYRTIERILSVNHSIDLSLFVLGVNKDWYNEEILAKPDGSSYIHDPMRYYDNTECIRLSGDIVRMLAQYPVPYNIDFPIYNTLRLEASEYQKVMTLPGWSVSEVSSFSKEGKNISTHTFAPDLDTLEDCGSVYSQDLLKHSLFKIRTYEKYWTAGSQEVYHLSIVPLVVLPPIESGLLNDLFGRLVGDKGLQTSCILSSNTARLRFVQYVLADRLARVFIQGVNGLLGLDLALEREYDSLRYLFPSSIISDINEIAEAFEGELEIDLPYVDNCRIQGEGDINELLDVNDALVKPFLDIYYNEELQSRELVKKCGKAVFSEDQYTSIIDRLNRGISLTDLIGKLGSLREEIRFLFVSAFLDRAVDEGIIVPITVEKDGIVYRAFRHGEDVQFGQQEERLCYDMLSAFTKKIGRKDIPKIWLEKMMVLLFQLGEGEVFMPIQTSLGAFNSISSSVASVRYYLQGPVLVRQPEENPFVKQYLEHAHKAEWMSSKMLQSRRSPLFLKDTGLFSFDEGIYKCLSTGKGQIVVDSKKTQFAKNVGLLFGFLLANGIKKEEPSINSDSLVLLTSSLESKSTIGALAAEINICHIEFTREGKDGVYNILRGVLNHIIDPSTGLERLRKSHWYQALNDGIRKYKWYREKSGYLLINDIAAQLEDDLYKTTWESLWSPNLESRGNTEKAEVINLAEIEGIWLLCACSYYLMLFYLLKKDIGETSNDDSDRIVGLNNMLNMHHRSSYVTEILPILSEFRYKKDDSHYSEETKLMLFERLITLVNRCPKILSTASEYYMNSLKLPQAKFYNHVLYVETTSAKSLTSIKDKYEFVRFRLLKTANDDVTDMLIIQNDELPVPSNHCVFISLNDSGLSWLLQLAVEINSSFRGKGDGVRMVLYPNLSSDCNVKVSYLSLFDGQLFGNLMVETYSSIDSQPYGSDYLCVVSEKNLDIRPFNSRYRDYSKTVLDKKSLFLPNNTQFTITKYQSPDESLKNKADIGIITILDEEANAVRDGFNIDANHPVLVRDRYYELADYSSNGKSFKIVHLQCDKQGNVPMAIATQLLNSFFNPNIVVLLGTAGGINDSVNIGDVVIPNDVIYYEPRKERPGEIISRRGSMFTPTHKMQAQISRFRSLFSRNTERDFKLHVNPIGTGEAVMGNDLSDIKRWLRTMNSKTCAIETEAAGFQAAFFETSNDSISHLIIRGISNNADPHRGDNYRKLASTNAVSVLKEFIDVILAMDSKSL